MSINELPSEYANMIFLMMGPYPMAIPDTGIVDNKDGTFTYDSKIYIGIKNTFNIQSPFEFLQIPSISPDNKIL